MRFHTDLARRRNRHHDELRVHSCEQDRSEILVFRRIVKDVRKITHIRFSNGRRMTSKISYFQNFHRHSPSDNENNYIFIFGNYLKTVRCRSADHRRKCSVHHPRNVPQRMESAISIKSIMASIETANLPSKRSRPVGWIEGESFASNLDDGDSEIQYSPEFLGAFVPLHSLGVIREVHDRSSRWVSLRFSYSRSFPLPSHPVF